MSHTITITRLPDDDHDDAEYTVGGTCDRLCRVWRECFNDKHRTKRTPEAHQWINGSWMVETNQCGEQYAYDLGLDAAYAQETGTYPLEVLWDGDGWIAVIDFDHRTPLAPSREETNE